MREDIKKRREKYEGVTTKAMRVFGGKQLIIERKEGLNPFHYKYMRNIQTKTLKQLFRKPANSAIASLMRPHGPSIHLQMQVAKHRAIKSGRLEEVVPETTSISKNIFTRLFNFFRNGWTAVPHTV